MPWKSPTKAERKKALLGGASAVRSIYKESFSLGIKKFFEIFYKSNSSAFFKQISNSDPSDWLLNHKEDGQTYEDFWKTKLISVNLSTYSLMPSSLKRSERSIYILPLGPFLPAEEKWVKSAGEKEVNPLLAWLECYCKAFFHSAKVILLPAEPLEKVRCDYRVNEFTGCFQLNATDILDYLRRRKTREQDCLIAVTMIDLFPKSSWNFVFGLASASKSSAGGVGVFSFCRYEDSFYERWSLTQDVVKKHEDGSFDYSVFSNHLKLHYTTAEENGRLLLRACKVMTHEVCHMFGLKHCIWMQCLMNGTNHLQESDRRPPYLCPVCLRKLQSVLNFDVLERYVTLFNWTVGKLWKVQSLDVSEMESAQSGSSQAQKGGSNARKKKSFTSSKQKSGKSSSQADSKKRNETKIPSGVPKPPLEYFSDFRFWLHDAIEFIMSHEAGFLPIASEDF